jgi:hypothetical protein
MDKKLFIFILKRQHTKFVCVGYKNFFGNKFKKKFKIKNF